MNEKESRIDVTDEYVDELIERLMNMYLTSQPIPGSRTSELTPKVLHNLCRAIMAEGYGR
jgi:hypothetical protein